MARLSRKLFGYENTGDTGKTRDNYTRGGYDGVAGKGIISVDFTINRGSFTTAPTITMPAPTDTEGKTAVLVPIYINVASVSTGAGKSGLVVGDTYTYAGTGGMIATVASVSGSNATFTLTNAGSGILLSAIPNTGNTQGVTLTKASGSGVSTFSADIFWHISTGGGVVPTSDAGEGYNGTETVTVSGTGGPTVTVVNFTTPSNTPYTEDAFPAFLITAKTTSNGTAKVGTIRKQKSQHRFYVQTSDGSAICTLKASAASNVGEMTLTATDSAGGTYYVTKIANRRATLVQGTGTQFANNSSIPWNFTGAVANVSVLINNA
jgi:hypothetical protein